MYTSPDPAIEVEKLFGVTTSNWDEVKYKTAGTRGQQGQTAPATLAGG